MSEVFFHSDPIDIPAGLGIIIDRLERSGFEAWLVGGCVRDHLLGRKPGDYDVTTNAPVSDTVRVFEKFRVIETGLKHGTVTVLSEGMPVEITTYRVDGSYSDGRHPDTVRFTSELSEDLRRRDFTINAMAYSPRRGFADPFGGRDDLTRGLIRCVGEPDRRFGEDALRILRGLRFSSVLGFEIDKATSESIHRCRQLLGRISVERITSELSGIVCGEGAERVLRDYSDVMAVIIPPLGRLFGFGQRNPHHVYDVWEHTLRVVSAVPADRVMRLAALLHDIGKPECFTTDSSGTGHFYGHAAIGADIAEQVFSRYIRTDNRTRDRVVELVRSHGEQIIPERRIIRRRLAKYGEETLRQLIALQKADVMGQAPGLIPGRLARLDECLCMLDEIAGESACLTLHDLNISGNDIISMGASKGPAVGMILKKLLAEVCDERLDNEAGALKQRAAQLIDAAKCN